MTDARHSLKTDDWGTPGDLCEVIRAYAPIDLDPCSSAKHNARVQAKAYLTTEDDGLTADWRPYVPQAGTVYCNPPGKRVPRSEPPSAAQWFDRCEKFAHRRYARIWFWCYNIDQLRHLHGRYHAVWLPKSRVRHVGNGSSPGNYSAMICLGTPANPLGELNDSSAMARHLETHLGGTALVRA